MEKHLNEWRHQDICEEFALMDDKKRESFARLYKTSSRLGDRFHGEGFRNTQRSLPNTVLPMGEGQYRFTVFSSPD